MTLPPFELHRATSADEAREILLEYGDDAAVICGGTELLLLLKLGYGSYRHLVDIKPIADLAGIRVDDETLVIGSTTTHRAIEKSSTVIETLPAFAAMERGVANIRVRSVGSLGGNLCFSDPHSDPAAFLLALDAEVEIRSKRLALADFLRGPYETALEHGELLRNIRIPIPPPATSIIHRKIAFVERPAVTVTCVVRATDGAIAEARIAVGSIGPRPLRMTEAEQSLRGAARHDTTALANAAALAAEHAEPTDDSNGSTEYKAHLVRVLVERSLREAVSTAT